MLDPPVAIDSDGTVYIGSYEGIIIAVNGESKGLANSSWPKYRRNSLNTGYNPDATSVEQTENEVPQDYLLSQNYPNPFNPSTTIQFALPKAGVVSLKVYNILGEEVAVLVNKEMNAGFQSINFDASHLSSGLYFYRISAGDFVDVKKILLIK